MRDAQYHFLKGIADCERFSVNATFVGELSGNLLATRSQLLASIPVEKALYFSYRRGVAIHDSINQSKDCINK